MILYRLSKGGFRNDLSGRGAELYGGRWNSKGVAVLYTAASRALCLAELAVHLPFGIIPKDYFMVSIEAPEESLERVDVASLPEAWNQYPHGDATQRIGDAFVAAGKSLILQVPSAVVEGDWNFLVNPAHPASAKLRVKKAVPFHFDERLFKR